MDNNKSDNLFNVIRSHEVHCRGFDVDNDPVLEEALDVIIVVYRDGMSVPLCNYCSSGSRRCETVEEKIEQGICPFSRAPRYRG